MHYGFDEVEDRAMEGVFLYFNRNKSGGSSRKES